MVWPPGYHVAPPPTVVQIDLEGRKKKKTDRQAGTKGHIHNYLFKHVGG
jgi:hypothetical protein